MPYELSSRDKFRIKSFIPILDALESNLGRRASVYDDVVKIFSFLADLTLSKVELQRGVELLMQEYPEDVNQNLTEELFHFHIYVRQTHKSSKKSTLSHTELYQIIFKENIQVAFPEARMWNQSYISQFDCQ